MIGKTRRDFIEQTLGLGASLNLAGRSRLLAGAPEGLSTPVQEKPLQRDLDQVLSPPAPRRVRTVEPISVAIGPQPQLFFDDFVVEDTALLFRRLHPITKSPENPVLREDHVWETPLEENGLPGLFLYGSVLWDPELKLFRMWYLTKPDRYTVCYAESKDGIEWKKPPLDIVPFRNSSRTNIVLASGFTYKGHRVVGEGGAQPLTVIRDENDTPQRRFKGAFTTSFGDKAGDREAGIMVCTSRDGLHWEFDQPSPVLPGWSDTSNTLFWDPLRKRYALIMRPVVFVGIKRRVAISVSSDFLQWSFPQVIMRCDEQDNPGAEPERRPVARDFCRQVYGMPVFAYEGLYVGLRQIFDCETNTIRVQLAHSRDGFHWETDPLRRDLIPLGHDGAWDDSTITAVPPVEVGNELRFYYGGRDWRHTVADRKEGHSSIGFGTLRRHGFYSLDSGGHQGQFITKPLLCEGSQLRINAAIRGDLRVQVDDSFGRPVAGFTLDECSPVSGDALNHEILWRGGKDLAGFRRKSLRLRMQINRGEIFSFQIS